MHQLITVQFDLLKVINQQCYHVGSMHKRRLCHNEQMTRFSLSCFLHYWKCMVHPLILLELLPLRPDLQIKVPASSAEGGTIWRHTKTADTILVSIQQRNSGALEYIPDIDDVVVVATKQ